MVPDRRRDADELRAEASQPSNGIDILSVSEAGHDRDLAPPSHQLYDRIVRRLAALAERDIVRAVFTSDDGVMAGETHVRAQDQAILFVAIEFDANLADPSRLLEMDAVGIGIDLIVDQQSDAVFPRYVQQTTVPTVTDQ